MSPERQQKIEEIVQTARKLSPGTRAIYITEQSNGDLDLQSEIEQLLTEFEDDEPMAGRVIGVYQITREIGRGGMGTVYEATRIDGILRQRVAIKLVKRGMDTDYILKRFRNERQILASLEHPNITRLLDGGTTDDGRPYFIMDYIEGLPLYSYCDTHRLAINERLQIFLQICEAVHYAHQNLIIHRDLKPSNIITTNDGAPKLLDFGIAKLLNPELALDTPPTATALRIMTVDYASPEQVSGQIVTTLSDVYSLGVILYELLTGHRPYNFQNRSPHEITRAICEDEPLHPSLAVIRSGSLALPTIYLGEKTMTISHIADLRSSSSPTELSKELAGNLDNIVLKALRKESAQRYQSVADFAEDILRHLQGKPISAPFYFPPQKNEPLKVAKKASKDKLIAVLPLKLLTFSSTENTDEAYLSVGLADSIITRLTSVRSFTVRPTSSILRYGHEQINPLQAGHELGVNFVLDGRIKRVADRIRVSLQLLDVENGSNVWAGQFDENFTDVLQLEDTISAQVANALIPHLTGEEKRQLAKRGTNNSEAYEAYLRGRYFWNQFTEESLPKALESFEKAIAIDPNYAAAYVGIADFYNWIAVFGVIPSNESFLKAKTAACRALELDNTLSEAYSVLAFSILGHDFDWAQAEQLVIKALDLNPNNSFAHEVRSYLLTTTNHFNEGLEAIQLSQKLDPLSPRTLLMASWVTYQSHHFSEAVEWAQKSLELDRHYPQGYLHLGNTLEADNKAEDAISVLRQAKRLLPNSTMALYMLCHALARANRRDEARKVALELENQAAKAYVKPHFIALAYAALDDREAAFEWLEKSIEERDVWFIWLGTEPKFKNLHGDARFKDLLRRTKNPIAQIQSVATKETDTNGEKSIAVLPFQLLGVFQSGDTGEEYLGIGLADSLITRLSHVKRLSVRPTSSILRYRNREDDPFQIGRSLNVDYVLDGNIRRIGEDLRVTVQLLNISQNSTRWAHQFDEQFTDILTLEDAISGQVIKTLIPHLTGEEKRQVTKRETNNPQAYELYMRGRFYWNQFTSESFPKALECFQKSVTLDPDYSLPQVSLADFYIWANIYGLLPSAVSYQKAEAALLRALELDSNSGEAYASLALISANHWEWEKGEQQYKKALELSPNYPLAHEWYASLLTGTRRHEEGIREMLRAEELDPLSLRAMTLVSWIYYQSRRYSDALAKARQIIDLDKYFPQGHVQLGLNLLQLGQPREAITAIKKTMELMPDSDLPKYSLCFALVADNQRDEAETVLQEMKEKAAAGYVKPYFIAMTHFALDETDEGFRILEESFAEYDPWLVWFATEPLLDKWRSDPRFIKLLQRTKNPSIK